MKNKKLRGFTLIELLTVIGVIGILAAILIPVAGNARSSARRAQCASNMRQIGLALRLYTDDHDGILPGIAHLRVEDSWVLSLQSYIGNVDEVRICPADPRADEMRKVTWATSYIMNDLIFLPEMNEFGQMEGANYRYIDRLNNPSQTMIAFIRADRRGISIYEDHTHATSWAGNWQAVLNDIAPDRHRTGRSDPARTSGSSNYLFADGHVESILAREIHRLTISGINIALPPESRQG